MKLIDLNVKIEYDPETDTIVNYTTILNGVTEAKTSTTKRVSKKKDISDDELLIREDNKLILSQKLIDTLGAVYEDRITIAYEQSGTTTFPVIGLDVVFGGKSNGNKLTKSNTVACRGNGNTVLAEFGTNFTIEPYTEGVYKLIGDSNATIQSVPEVEVKKVDMGIEVTGDKNYEIKDLDFKL